MLRLLAACIVCVAALTGTAGAGTLDEVRARGKLLCGVNPGLQGFAVADAQGDWSGFDVDLCRAVAAAVLGDGESVTFVPLDAAERFDKLKSGAVDILARNTTWTMERETKLGLRFAGISYHDGQGFIVKRLLGVTSALQLSGAAICFLAGTTTQANVEDFFREKDMTFTPVMFSRIEDLVRAFESGKCDTYTADLSQLYAVRLRLADPEDAVVLPDVISKEPLGPAVRQGDEQWLNIVRWTLFALINAEELDVTAAGAETLAVASKSPPQRRLLGKEGNFGPDMGLESTWSLRAITAVGNYGEIFERNLGKETPLGIARGLNALWDEGGLLYVPPLR